MAEPKTTLYLAASRGIRPREVPLKRSHSYKVLCVNKSSDEFNQTLLREYKRFGDFSIRIAQDLEESVTYVCFHTAANASKTIPI